MELSFNDFNINVKGVTNGLMKTVCPECSHTRKKKSEPCLSINVSEGIWKCHNPGCGFQGSLKTHGREQELRKSFKIPKTIAQYSPEFLKYFKGRKISELSLKKAFVFEKKAWMPSCGQDFKKSVNTAHFPVFRGTTPCNVKMRSIETKEFRQIKKSTEGVKISMIGLSRIPDKGSYKHVVIVEGEIDYLTYLEVEALYGGDIYAISVPQGAPNPEAANYIKYFEFLDPYTVQIIARANYIYLSLDDDAPGIKLRDELARRLGKEKCRIVSYPDGCKDINDVICKEGPEAVIECLKTTKPYPIQGLIRVGQVNDQIAMIRDNGFQRGLITGIPKIDKRISLKEKLLYIITGVPGSGKTTWVDDWLVKLINNNPNEDIHCAYYSPENRPVGRAMAKIMEKKAKKPLLRGSHNAMTEDEVRHAKYWLDKHFAFIYPDTKVKNILFGKELKNPNTLKSILTYARLSVEQYGSNVLVIDPWNKMEHEIGNMSETNYISRALDMCLEFGDRYDMSIIMIAHPSKSVPSKIYGNYEKPSLINISGSANWHNKADVGVVVHRDKFWVPPGASRPVFNPNAATEVYIQKQKFSEIGEEGYFFQYMDQHQGDIFVDSKEDRIKVDYKKLKAKERSKQSEIELKIEIKKSAADELAFGPFNDDLLLSENTDLPF